MADGAFSQIRGEMIDGIKCRPRDRVNELLSEVRSIDSAILYAEHRVRSSDGALQLFWVAVLRELRGYITDYPKTQWAKQEWLWRERTLEAGEIWVRFVLPRVSPEPNSGCWLWTGTGRRQGRGILVVNRQQTYVARMACAIFYGGNLADRTWFACHHCDTPSCVNPDHLYVGNKSTNTLDDFRRGRRPLGPQKTVCRNGHPQTPENTTWQGPDKWHPRGQRTCKLCHVENQRRYLDRKRGAYLAD